MIVHARTSSGWWLWGVLQVGFTPAPCLTSLLLFKCRERDQQQRQEALMASSAVWLAREALARTHTFTATL